jgi:HK97 family phage prohead protease
MSIFAFVKQEETSMKNFVLNDETKRNSHGFYLVNTGGRFERFRENPVMLHMHDPHRLIGKWNNLTTDGSLLMAEPEFDEGDPEAVKIKGKVERGYLKGASVGIIIHAARWRVNPATNEQELYVTDWELFEVSLVSVPSNAGALTLKVYDNNCHLIQEDRIKLHIEHIIQLSVSRKENKQTIKNETMAEIKLTAEALVALGITEGADGTAISAAIIHLKKDADDMKAGLKVEKEKREAAAKKQAEDMVELAVQAGKIAATDKQTFIDLAVSNYEMAQKTLGAIPAKQSLSAQIKSVVEGGDKIPADRAAWTLLQWMQKDMAGLQKLRAELPGLYEEIKKK